MAVERDSAPGGCGRMAWIGGDIILAAGRLFRIGSQT
jgi:hypothetical protein